MSETRPVRERLREARQTLALRKAELELKRIDRLVEGQCDWGRVGGYLDLYDRWRRPDGFPPGLAASASDRKRGENWPLFRTEQELAILRQASRVMAATNDYGLGLLSGITAYVVGPGMGYRATPRKGAQADKATLDALCAAVDLCIEDFHERSEWFGGEQPGLEVELLERWVTDGEFFVRQWATDDGDTDTRVVEPERVTQPTGKTATEPGEDCDWSFGVKTPADDVQRVLGYWHFDGGDPADGDEVGPEDMTHCRRNVPRSVKRGSPDFAWGTYDSLERSDKLTANMAQGAAVQAAIAWVEQYTATKEEVQSMDALVADFTTTDPHTGRAETHTRWEPGTVVKTDKGRTFAPSPVSQYLQTLVPVLQAALLAAGRRWCAPQWMCSGDASNNNYSSSLTAESPFVRTVLREQGRITVVFARIHEVAVRNRCEAGRLRTGDKAWAWDEVRALVKVECKAPSPETRDKDKEAARRAVEVLNGAYSPQLWCADEGRDYDQVQAEREAHAKRSALAGLPVLAPTPAPPAPGAAAA